MAAPSLVVLGDAAWDVMIRTDQELLRGGDTLGEVRLLPGGSAANVAVWAVRSGQRATFVGKVGDDRFGALAEEDLRAEGVELALLRSRSRPTAAVAVLVGPSGERTMVSGQGADFTLRPGELPRARLEGASHLHLSAWSLFEDPPRAAAIAAARLAKSAGASLSLDPASFQMIERFGAERFVAMTRALEPDTLFPNLAEGQALSGEQAPEAVAACLATLYEGALVALKLDAEGALIFKDGALLRVPPGPDTRVDATGAGDSFAGAFLARSLRGEPPARAAALAVAVSSWTVGRVGARPRVDAELQAILDEAASA